MGITFAIFKHVGKYPCKKQSFIIFGKINDIAWAPSLYTFGDIFSWASHFESEKEQIMSNISFEFVGCNTKEFWGLFSFLRYDSNEVWVGGNFSARLGPTLTK